MTGTVLIFSHTVTPRLQYVVDFLSEYYIQEFIITTSEEEYTQSKVTCKINYSYQSLLTHEIWIQSHVLLFESYIRPVKISCFEIKGYPAFFKTEGDTGFDLFAGIFYLITRFEEYLPYKTDAYNRFPHEYSVAFHNGFLHFPLVNIWLEDFRKLMNEKSGNHENNMRAFSFLPTYDIDIAWSYLNKGVKRNTGGIFLSIIRWQWKKINERIRVLRRKVKDPFDSYEFLDKIHNQFQLKPLYFILAGKRRNKYDKNINTKNRNFIKLIQDISSKYAIGIHPSWASGDNKILLNEEKQFLESITNCKIDKSRQHYIRFKLPFTFQNLIDNGVRHDYSMGYGSINGFRASIANDYLWYDLINECTTSLRIHPFCFMDSNAFYEQKLSAMMAFEELKNYYEIIKKVNGKMITVWHNNFLGSEEEFMGWKEVYIDFLNFVYNKNQIDNNRV